MEQRFFCPNSSPLFIFLFLFPLQMPTDRQMYSTYFFLVNKSRGGEFSCFLQGFVPPPHKNRSTKNFIFVSQPHTIPFVLVGLGLLFTGGYMVFVCGSVLFRSVAWQGIQSSAVAPPYHCTALACRPLRFRSLVLPHFTHRFRTHLARLLLPIYRAYSVPSFGGRFRSSTAPLTRSLHTLFLFFSAGTRSHWAAPLLAVLLHEFYLFASATLRLAILRVSGSCFSCSASLHTFPHSHRTARTLSLAFYSYASFRRRISFPAHHPLGVGHLFSIFQKQKKRFNVLE